MEMTFEDDAILTVTGDENKAEHFENKFDGKYLGETEENAFDRWQHCGKDSDAFIAKGWSHGSFPLPKGKSETWSCCFDATTNRLSTTHKPSIQWIKGDMAGWWYGAGQYRLDYTCKCYMYQHVRRR